MTMITNDRPTARDVYLPQVVIVQSHPSELLTYHQMAYSAFQYQHVVCCPTMITFYAQSLTFHQQSDTSYLQVSAVIAEANRLANPYIHGLEVEQQNEMFDR